MDGSIILAGAVPADADLVARSRDGDVAAYARIVERYRSVVSAMSYSASGDRNLAEDVAQETFLVAWRRLHTVKQPTRLRSWLCGIARNLGLAARRRAGRERPVPADEVARIAEASASPLQTALSRESEQLAWDALDAMPETYRVPLILYYREGQSVDRVAEALGISPAAVQQRLSRGRTRLRTELTGIVETTLSRQPPAGTFVAAVVAAITAGAAPAAAQVASHHGSTAGPHAATRGSQGVTMFAKIGLGIAITAASGAAVFTVARGSENDGTETETETEAEAAATAGSESAAPGRAAIGAPSRLAAPAPMPSPSAVPGTDWVVTVGVIIDDKPASLPPEVKLTGCFAPGGDADPSLAGDYDAEVVVDAGPPRRVTATLLGDPAWVVDRAVTEACIANEAARLTLSPGTHTVRGRIGVQPEQPTPTDDDARAALRVDSRTRGAANAPVTMTVYTDFSCKFCGSLLATLDQLSEDYPEVLSIAINPYPISPAGRTAALAAIAAAQQGRFWDMHDALFQHQHAQTRADVIEYATGLGLNVQAFTRALDAEATADALEASMDDARRLGVAGTPTMILNDERLRGALPIDMYRPKIQAILAR